jgi:hypothetical protein
LSYDCSVTNRKGCNYCLRGKEIGGTRFGIKIVNKNLELTYDESDELEINYCFICGRKLD